MSGPDWLSSAIGGVLQNRDYDRGSGEAFYHPQLLLGIIVYGYATGVFSSRKLERATYDSLAFRFIAANGHPDHDTIAAFRRRLLPQIEGLFVQVLGVAREMGVLKLGTVALDGTKNRHLAPTHADGRQRRGSDRSAPGQDICCTSRYAAIGSHSPNKGHNGRPGVSS